MEEIGAEGQGKMKQRRGVSSRGCVSKQATTMGNGSLIVGRSPGNMVDHTPQSYPMEGWRNRVFIHIKSHEFWLSTTPEKGRH